MKCLQSGSDPWQRHPYYQESMHQENWFFSLGTFRDRSGDAGSSPGRVDFQQELDLENLVCACLKIKASCLLWWDIRYCTAFLKHIDISSPFQSSALSLLAVCHLRKAVCILMEYLELKVIYYRDYIPSIWAFQHVLENMLNMFSHFCQEWRKLYTVLLGCSCRRPFFAIR